MVKNAQKCPVCNGWGEIPEKEKDFRNGFLGGPKKTCHGCNGRGWVEVDGNSLWWWPLTWSEKIIINYPVYSGAGDTWDFDDEKTTAPSGSRWVKTD